MARKYESVLGLAKDLLGADEGAKLEEELKSRQVAKALFAMRAKRGLTQAELAKKAHLSQGKISKIENSVDAALSMKDLISYCSALGMQIEIGFADMKLTIPERVKMHYFKLKELLDHLRELAKGDEAIERGVQRFTAEAFFNISFGLLDCLSKVKPPKKTRRPIHVNPPVSTEDLLLAPPVTAKSEEEQAIQA